MPHKRSRKKNSQKFYCPYCDKRLWRVGSPKYHLFHQGKENIQKNLKLTHKKASFLASQQSVVVNDNIWLEEFFCEKDGKIWFYVERTEKGSLTVKLATREHWKNTTRTIDTERPSNTASEYSYKMSRQADPALINKYKKPTLGVTH
ncbi:hypothetical protein [Gloeothece verrucosa]|uniref:Uncharacterized protein n=1 Tax=Gloeothece verrucosa (strain PCC 7822) TaxID=497965 RepID=E0UKU6_GLOV7|nr:hypothetical protein [Gloeothece verrucosa]ADN17576.1 conserved hypothetical protein [Gloeothece verrucosa PCC 7822]